jgi:GntR family transcriptional regulator
MANALVRTSPLPLYYQIANVIRSRIDLHEWAPGEQLPSESALAASFGVSPLTVRQALAMLVQEGWVRRQQGRGTFVTDEESAVKPVRLTAPFHGLMSAVSGLKLRLLDLQRTRGPSGVLRLLGIPAGGEMVRLSRVRLRGKRPVSYEVLYLPPKLAELLSKQDFNQKLITDALEEKAGVFFSAANQTIEASLADDDSASALQVAVGAPLLLVQRTYELDTGGIGLVAVNRYPSQSFCYEIRLVRLDTEHRPWQISADPEGLTAESH